MICVYNNQSTGQHWLLKWLCCQTRVEVLLFRDFIALPVNKLPTWNSKITNFICWEKTAQAEVKQIGFRQVSKRFSKVSDDLIPHLKLCAILSWLEIDVRDSGSHHSFSRPSNQSHFFFHQLLLHELPFWGVNSIRFPSSFNLSKNEGNRCLIGIWDLRPKQRMNYNPNTKLETGDTSTSKNAMRNKNCRAIKEPTTLTKRSSDQRGWR